MQMVILAGGMATRLGPIAETTPKSMALVQGRPFLEHQIELVCASGITEFVLCIGHLGGQIREYFGSGERFGARIAYSDEGENLLGTGGAVKKAEPLLDGAFCLMWGDSYLLVDYGAVAEAFTRRGSQAMMAVYRNENEGDTSNVVVQDGKVVRYDKWSGDPGMVYIDYGLSVLSKPVLDRIPPGGPHGIETVFRDLAGEGLLDAYEASQRFYEIGSVSGLQELEALLAAEQE